MYCKNCGTQLEDGTKFCSACGTNLEQPVCPPSVEQQPAYTQPAYTQPVYQKPVYHQPVYQYPAEPQPVCTHPPTPNPPKKKKKKFYNTWWFWTLIVIFAIGLLAEPEDGQNQNDPSGSNSATTTQTSPSSSNLILDERSQFILDAQEGGLQESTAENIYDLLKTQLLCTDICFKKKSDVGNALYEITEKNYALKVAADNDGIYSVRCGSYEMYDGEVVHYTVPDLELRDTNGKEAYYSVIAKEIVESYLKAPSSAKYPSLTEFRMQRYGDIVAVSGYVDSQNSFGAMIRSEWVVQFRTDHNNLDSFAYQVLYVRIGDQEVGEFIPFE